MVLGAVKRRIVRAAPGYSRGFASRQQPEQQQPEHHAAQPEEAQLAFLELEQAREGALPPPGRQERKEALDDKHEGTRGPERVPVQVRGPYFLPGAGAALPAPLPRKARKKSELEGSMIITSPFLPKL